MWFYLIYLYHRLIKSDEKYLFILAPPFSGSTLLTELIGTSKSVSLNNNEGVMEGMKLPDAYSLYGNFEERWNPKFSYKWHRMEQLWRKHWNLNQKLLVEKSPPLIMRSFQLKEAFPNSSIIVLVRDPIAHSESLMRRRDLSPTKAAEFALLCLKAQKHTAVNMKDAMVIKYEEITGEQDKFTKLLTNKFPMLKDIQLNRKFNAHNYLNQSMPLKNLNSSKKDKLKQEELEEIENVFSQSRETLSYFGY